MIRPTSSDRQVVLRTTPGSTPLGPAWTRHPSLVVTPNPRRLLSLTDTNDSLSLSSLSGPKTGLFLPVSRFEFLVF